MTSVSRRVLALLAIFATASAVVVAGPSHRAAADDYPGQAEIEAAREAASSVAAGIDDLDNAIAALADARDKATANAALAADRYSEAKFDAEQAEATLTAAVKRADEADAALAVARENLAALAQAAYRDSDSMGQMGAVVGAESVDEVVARSEAYTRGSDEMDRRVQEVKAAELVATTMRGYAEDAAEAAAAAEQEAASSLAEAEDAQRHAEEAVATAEATREDAIGRLAELRGVTVELERQRQEGLEAERAERAREQAEREQREAEQEWQDAQPQPTTTSNQRPTQTSDPDPRPTTTSTPRPTETPNPRPTETSTPKPTETPKPEPEPEQPGTSWSSTADQGVAAANAALALAGSEYLLGGNGPKYDCSGITSTAWSAAGLWITRSSRSQYLATTHLPYSQIRPGDLVFYATDTSDPSTIFHVAIYVGNGMVMEAVNTSKPAGTRGLYAWMSGSMMPYIGRP